MVAIPQLDKQSHLKPLNEMQSLFVSNYLIDFNATKAAAKAGYANPNMMGSKLLAIPQVMETVVKILNARIYKNELTAERLLQELSYAALRDPLDLCDENGSLRTDMRELPPQIRRCIDSIKQRVYTDKDGNTTVENELKLVGKMGAIELAMKHLGMLNQGAMNRIGGDAAVVNWDALYEDSSIVEDDKIDDVAPSVQTPDPNTIEVVAEPPKPKQKRITNKTKK